MNWLLICLIVGGPRESGGAACVPQDCLRTVQEHAPALVVDPAAVELPGIWVRGRGLAGRLLYVFDDGTYIHTEWADVMPERVLDKGAWRVVDRVLTLSSDPDVTWKVRWDQRYFLLRVDGASDQLLFGLDRSMVGFRYFVTRYSGMSGVDALSTFGLVHTPWAPTQAAQARKRLMTDAWHPELFAAEK